MESFIKATKTNKKEGGVEFEVEMHNVSKLEALVIAADIVLQIEDSAKTDGEKARVRTEFLKLLNEMRICYENTKN